MALTAKNLKDQQFKEPMVVFPLKQYENLMEYLEEMEDRISVLERLNEPTISQEEVEESFNRKFGNK